MTANAIHFAGTDFMLIPNDISTELMDALVACGQPGPADDAVAHVLANFQITGEPDDCRAMLRPYGAWDDDELQDHDTNLSRLVWLVGCDLNERGEAYFSGY